MPASARLLTFLLLLGLAVPVYGQTVTVEPASLNLQVGETAQLNAVVRGADGQIAETPVLFFTRSRKALAVDRQSGTVEAVLPGSYVIYARTVADRESRVTVEIPVEVAYPPLQSIEADVPAQMYAGTMQPVETRVFDAANLLRDNAEVTITSRTPDVVSFSGGRLRAHAPGDFVLELRAEDVTERVTGTVVANPIARVEIIGGDDRARTGDVLDFDAVAYDTAGNVVMDAPVTYAFYGQPDDDLGPPATGQIKADGRFVADLPGAYTIIAGTGSHTDQRTVRIDARDVQRPIEFIGHGQVLDKHTSDLWVWEGVDGRDYAITGTWGADGEAYFWDVTDPANMFTIDTVRVDARTVNDVKISEDGRIGVMSREGASNRRNGFVLLDVSNPRDVQILSTFDENLTGGVHNTFIYDNHVFALSAGQRYDIINIENPREPRRVGTFELDTPGHSIHDVWVEDGIAYSSNWSDGVWMVDVGNGKWGGSPSNPVAIGHYAYPSGWNHAAFPYKDEKTGKFYIIGGDEAFPYGLDTGRDAQGNLTARTPARAAGWLHFIDFTDPENPEEVARYQVPEAGTHNFWVEDDVLYVAYYNGGLRVVDLSGDLMGELYTQGREIARYIPTTAESLVPNAPFVWGPQPHKGHIFFSDWNSGLWSVKLQTPPKPATDL